MIKVFNSINGRLAGDLDEIKGNLYSSTTNFSLIIAVYSTAGLALAFYVWVSYKSKKAEKAESCDPF